MPTPLPDGRVEVLFSARDEGGQARIGRAEISLGQTRESRISPDPILDVGELGSFDDSGVTSSCLVEHNGRRYLFYTGWTRGVTVPFYLFAGCAVGSGGEFVRIANAPILERNEIDPYLTASPWVLVEDGLWRMWYVSGTGWRLQDGQPKHWYHIKYAESDDGLMWRRDGRVCIDYGNEFEHAMGRPCVMRDTDRYKMWFSVRGDSYRIGYAESADGLTWTRHGNVRLTGADEDWDAEMQTYPAVLDVAGRRHMLYNGNDYGREGIGHALLEG